MEAIIKKKVWKSVVKQLTTLALNSLKTNKECDIWDSKYSYTATKK